MNGGISVILSLVSGNIGQVAIYKLGIGGSFLLCYVPDDFVDGFYLCLFHNFHEFDSSNQRYMFHQENHGKCILLGGVQHKIIIFYMTKKGKTCEILLSADEWWYISHPFISFWKYWPGCHL
jgi:hypothetical protein